MPWITKNGKHFFINDGGSDQSLPPPHPSSMSESGVHHSETGPGAYQKALSIANEKSEVARSSGSPGDHHEAATAHRMAASLTSEPANVSRHMVVAEEHEKAAISQTSNPAGKTTLHEIIRSSPHGQAKIKLDNQVWTVELNPLRDDQALVRRQVSIPNVYGLRPREGHFRTITRRLPLSSVVTPA